MWAHVQASRDRRNAIAADEMRQDLSFARREVRQIGVIHRQGGSPRAVRGHAQELDLDRIRRERTAWGLFRDRRPDLYKGLLNLDGREGIE